MPLLILIGDSIRMGYQSFVQEELEEEFEIFAPKENGGTSANILAHLNEWIINLSPDIVHLNCGLHDIKREFDAEENNINIEQYSKNVELILREILDKTNAKVIFALTTPVNEKWHHARKGFDRFEDDVKAYNHEAIQISRKLSVEINDLYNVVMEAGRDEILQNDGVHFTEEGSKILARAVVKAVRESEARTEKEFK